ncbi:D-alanyl-D-alanine carboxypeptidase family protein [Corynebacterium sp. NPDC060344]|uniref:D-alanyl-D-alanine carboxypeptidase family protein n=1 Tax=Corynebacterium sp. NPDC060344 TaxID=3347101 RepID=UPI00365AC787
MDTTTPNRPARRIPRGTALAVAAALTLGTAPIAAPIAEAAPTAEPAAMPASPGEPAQPDPTSAEQDQDQDQGQDGGHESEEEDEPTGPAPGRRDTAGCAFRTTPPPPVDSSEVPAPGLPSPDPLPVPATPAGGPRMADCNVVASRGFDVPDDVAASSWIVFDAGSGEVIAAKDPHGRYRPASIAKVLLALVAIDELPMDRTITARYEDAAIEGSRAGILEGVDYDVEKLLLGLLMSSGNDAASALSGALGGRGETLRKVNRKARELGATDTRIADFTGLDGPGQTTSAFDMALFYRAAFADPEYKRLSGTPLTEMPGDEDADIEGFTMSNDNQLLASGFEGALGGKTGFTDDSRHTFVGFAARDGRRLGTVVLDTTVEEGPRAWQQSAALLESGFATPTGSTIADMDVPAEFDGGDEPGPEDMEEEILDATGDGGAEDDGGPSASDLAIVAGVAGMVLVAVGAWAVRSRRR